MKIWDSVYIFTIYSNTPLLGSGCSPEFYELVFHRVGTLLRKEAEFSLLYLTAPLYFLILLNAHYGIN